MLTYLDSGVLIAASRGNETLSAQANKIIDDPVRTFVSSPFQHLETTCISTFFGYMDQVSWYEAFFQSAEVKFGDAGAAVKKAQEITVLFGVSGVDAMHVAAAVLANASEFITTENPTRPLFRSGMPITVRHLAEVGI